MTTILIVDDSAVIRRVMSLTLETEGFEVLTAGNGQQAIELLQSKPVDFVFCDYYMPEMDGLAVLSFARSNAATQELPIVILTGAGEQDHHEKAFALGANDVLTKPLGSKDVFAAVRRHLNLPALAANSDQRA